MALQLGDASTSRPEVVVFDPDDAMQTADATAKAHALEAQGYRLRQRARGKMLYDPPARNVHCGLFRILSQNGDDRVVWDRRDPGQVREAHAKFTELMQRGYTAYAVVRGKRSHKLDHFNPSLEEVLFVPKSVPG